MNKANSSNANSSKANTSKATNPQVVELLRASILEMTHLMDRQSSLIQSLQTRLALLKAEVSRQEEAGIERDKKMDNLISFSYVTTFLGILYAVSRFVFSLN